MKIKRSKLKELSIKYFGNDLAENQNKILLKIATARCARVSYLNFEGKDDYEADIKLYDTLLQDGHCFDEKTEILTSTGYKFIKDVTKEDLIAAVNISTGQFKGFEKPNNLIHSNYKGIMYKYESKNIDLFCTEGHNLLGVPINTSKDRTKSYESIEVFAANKLRNAKPHGSIKYTTYGEQELRMFSAVQPKKIDEYNPNYVRGQLDGFFIGDGYKSSTNIVKFRLKKERKIKYITNILNELNIEYIIRITKNNITEIKFVDDNYFTSFYNKIGEKVIGTTRLDEMYLYGLFDGLKNSDGSIKRSTWVYDTCSKELHDKILSLCPIIGLTGYSNPSYQLKNKSINHAIHYRVSFTTNNHILVNDSKTLESKVKLVPFNGMVYCVEIPSHGIMVRRNGKTLITHNCSPFEHCARVMTNEEYGSFYKGGGFNSPFGEGFAWCNNFRGFIQLREVIENSI